MRYGSLLVFSCPNCNEGKVLFSVLRVEEELVCDCCGFTCAFDASMRQSIRKFAALCSRVYDASSILGDAAVSVSIRESSVDVPFQLLFSRFPVTLNLNIGNKQIRIRFVFDALQQKILHQEEV